jgi:hypothetical protein
MLSASDQGEPAMNAFYEHHRDSIRFGYRCFDRILLNGLIQPFQQPERVVGFFDTYRRLYPVSRDVLRGAAEQFQCWVKDQADKWNAPIVEAPKGRRDEFVDPYFKRTKPDQVVVILKAREQRSATRSSTAGIFEHAHCRVLRRGAGGSAGAPWLVMPPSRYG